MDYKNNTIRMNRFTTRKKHREKSFEEWLDFFTLRLS